jgi:hypothetical protein
MERSLSACRPVETRRQRAARTAAAIVVSPSTNSKQLVEQIAEPRFKDVDLGFGHRHVLGPVIRHRPRRPIALRPSPARTSGRSRVVVKIIECRVDQCMPSPRFLSGSHGATVASLANRQNNRSPRHITLQRRDLALPLQLERICAQQAMNAWQQRAGPAEHSQGRKPAEPVAHSASLDGAPLVRQRPPMRSWPDIVPSTRGKPLCCDG